MEKVIKRYLAPAGTSWQSVDDKIGQLQELSNVGSSVVEYRHQKDARHLIEVVLRDEAPRSLVEKLLEDYSPVVEGSSN